MFYILFLFLQMMVLDDISAVGAYQGLCILDYYS